VTLTPAHQPDAAHAAVPYMRQGKLCVKATGSSVLDRCCAASDPAAPSQLHAPYSRPACTPPAHWRIPGSAAAPRPSQPPTRRPPPLAPPPSPPSCSFDRAASMLEKKLHKWDRTPTVRTDLKRVGQTGNNHNSTGRSTQKANTHLSNTSHSAQKQGPGMPKQGPGMQKQGGKRF